MEGARCNGATRNRFPCARITSIRFKGTLSVGAPCLLRSAAANTPSEVVPQVLRQPDAIMPASRQCHAGEPPGDTPSSSCRRGLVVVYCSGMARSGNTRSAAAQAASVASWKPQTMSFFLPG
jgi:hypothetical protein